MLMLSRRLGESVTIFIDRETVNRIGDCTVVVRPTRWANGRVDLGFAAPREIPILRQELIDAEANVLPLPRVAAARPGGYEPGDPRPAAGGGGASAGGDGYPYF